MAAFSSLTATLHRVSHLRFIANPKPFLSPHSIPFYSSLTHKAKVLNSRFSNRCFQCLNSTSMSSTFPFYFFCRNRLYQWLRNRWSQLLTIPVSMQPKMKLLRDTLCSKLWDFIILSYPICKFTFFFKLLVFHYFHEVFKFFFFHALFQLQMFRIKDPKVSLDFYSRVLGMS